jgi:hypothetical protein
MPLLIRRPTPAATVPAMTITPEPGAPKSGNRPVKRLLVIAAVMLVVCCGGAVAAAFGIYRYGSPAGPAREKTDAFLAALEAGDAAKAYPLLCPTNRAHLSEASFTNLVAAQARLRSHKIVGTSVSTVNGQRSALITTELTRDGGIHERHVVPLVVEGGTWYVCGEPY